MRRDELIDNFIQPLAQLLVDHAEPDATGIVLTALFLEGSQRVSATFTDASGRKKAIIDFFAIVRQMKENYLLPFRNAYAVHGDNFVAMRLRLDAEGNFEIDFEYDNPYIWDKY